MEFISFDSRYESYLQDESRFSGHADYFVFPKNISELVAALKKAAAENFSVTVQGALTGITGGAVPRGGLVINLSKMNKISDLHFSDNGLSLRAEAGVTLAQIDECLQAVPSDVWQEDVQELEKKTLAKKSFFFAPSPTEKTASIGGLFASNAGGLHSLAYGRSALQVSELCWVTMKGDVWHIKRGEFIFDASGCTLPKGNRLDCSVSLKMSPLGQMIPHEGMDLIDFLAASEGALGIAAELKIRLREEAKQLWGVLYFFESEETENKFLQEFYAWHKDNAGTIIACEYYDASALSLVSENKTAFSALKGLPDFPENVKSALYVELAGNEEETLNEQLFSHLEMFLSSGGQEEHTWAADGSQEMEKFRNLRHSIPELVNTQIDGARQGFSALTKMAGDFSAPCDMFLRHLRMYQKALRESNISHCLFGHLFENHFHINFIPKDNFEVEKSKTLLDLWARELVSEGGNLAAENGVGKIKEKWIRQFLTKEYKEHFEGIIQTFREM